MKPVITLLTFACLHLAGIAESAVADQRSCSPSARDLPASSSPAVAKGTLRAAPTEETSAALSLVDQLDRLAKHHAIAIYLDPAIKQGPGVPSVEKTLPLEEILARLLKDYDYFLLYSNSPGGNTNRLSRIWVYPRGGWTGERFPSGAIPFRATAGDSGAGRSPHLADTIVDATDEKRVQVINQALASDDESTRDSAIQIAIQENMPLPREQLEDILRNDPSEQVRATALGALKLMSEQDPIALQALIELAGQDQSEMIRILGDELSDLQQSSFQSLPAPGESPETASPPD